MTETQINPLQAHGEAIKQLNAYTPSFVEILQTLRKYGVSRYKDSEMEVEFFSQPTAFKDDGLPMLPEKMGIANGPDATMPEDMLGYSCGLDIVEPKPQS